MEVRCEVQLKCDDNYRCSNRRVCAVSPMRSFLQLRT